MTADLIYAYTRMHLDLMRRSVNSWVESTVRVLVCEDRTRVDLDEKEVGSVSKKFDEYSRSCSLQLSSLKIIFLSVIRVCTKFENPSCFLWVKPDWDRI